MKWKPTNLPYSINLDTIAILKKLAVTHRSLAELKGTAQSIPRQEVLINSIANFHNRFKFITFAYKLLIYAEN